MAGPRLELVGILKVYSQEGGYADDSIVIVNDGGDDIAVTEAIAVAFRAVRDRDGNYKLGRVRIVIEAVDVDTKGVTTWQSSRLAPDR